LNGAPQRTLFRASRYGVAGSSQCVRRRLERHPTAAVDGLDATASDLERFHEPN
jgi:hypothetical protein